MTLGVALSPFCALTPVMADAVAKTSAAAFADSGPVFCLLLR
jgi:hypothetical protein